MALKFKTRQVDGITILDLSGRITLAKAASPCATPVKDALSKGSNRILLNLADVDYIDSSGIGELVSAYTSVKNAGGELKLLKLTKKVPRPAADHQALHGLRRPRRRNHRRLLLRRISNLLSFPQGICCPFFDCHSRRESAFVFPIVHTYPDSESRRSVSVGFAVALSRLDPFYPCCFDYFPRTAITSISTSAHGAASAAT